MSNLLALRERMMPIEHVDNWSDPRLDPYRNLKDRELAQQGDLFIAEGKFIVERLIQSDHPVVSVMAAQRRLDLIAPLVPDDIPLYIVPEPVVHQVVGYKFHSGILAVGRRKPPAGIDDVLQNRLDKNPGKPLTLMVLPETRNAENIGALLRISAAFGVDAVILGPQCTDPYWRRTIRVSMGAIFRLPLVVSDNLERDLERLREHWRVTLVAAVLDESAEKLPESQRPGCPGPAAPDRMALLFGPEDHGLSAQWIHLCDRRITLPMQLGVDSLNVAVAAAVFLYHFTNFERS